ncbi:MAG: superfamily [Acidimicrobiales bacterium]|jgi:hypothetical protein|nr:superfamily [Acidimicrobiales bacterium]
MTQTVETETATPQPRVKRLRWWREVAYVLAFYGIYTVVRNTQGSAGGVGGSATHHAFQHAKQIIRTEQWLHIYRERAVQHLFIHVGASGEVAGQTRFIEFWNLFYGTFHFIVTGAAMVLLFRRFPQRYPTWRNALACTTALALVGFAFYPLMPPRLLGTIVPHHYGFIDTLDEIGSLWTFDSGTMQRLSNQYAAMPSLHFAWSTWSVCVLWPMMRHWWSKALVAVYPIATLFAIVVTANHYVLDAAGGVVVLVLGFLLGRAITRLTWPDGVPPRVVEEHRPAA